MIDLLCRRNTAFLNNWTPWEFNLTSILSAVAVSDLRGKCNLREQNVSNNDVKFILG